MNDDLEKAKKYFLRGLQYFENEKYLEAKIAFEKSLEICPNRVSGLVNLTATLIKLKEYADAKNICEKILKISNDTSEAWLNLGLISLEVHEFEVAIRNFDEALKITPDYPDALTNKGCALQELGDKSEALALHERAIQLNPKLYAAWLNKGVLLNQLGRYEEAIQTYDKALTIRPNHFQALTNLGATLAEGLGRYHDALGLYQAALSIKKDYADAHWNESIARLAIGDFARGWEKYEFRWLKTKSNFYKHSNIPPLIKFLDVEIKGKTILVWFEQGYGDAIQFCRFIQLLHDLGAVVYLEIPAALRDLFLSLSCCHIIDYGNAPTNFDYQIPMLSLPAYFHLDLRSISQKYPYLHPTGGAVNRWKEVLRLSAKTLNIGLCCSGNLKLDKRSGYKRPIPLHLFSELVDRANCFLIQKDLTADDQLFLNQNPKLHYLGDQIQDFNDSAAIIENLDLVISIDSALAHLSGAMGKKTFVLLPSIPDWRWISDAGDSTWYPSAILLKQVTAGNWSDVILEVQAKLLSEDLS